jgi:GDPmannose 4,6-dehydratase
MIQKEKEKEKSSTLECDRSMKKALITGITGQDGSYLAELLLDKDYEVSGLVRKTSHQLFPNIAHIQNRLNLIYADLLDNVSLTSAVSSVKPDELYNLASQSAPGESFKQPIHTAEITAVGAHRMLDVVRAIVPQTRFYQASSSEMYGWVKEIPQSEDTPHNPANPYAVAKLYGHYMARVYRKSYDMFIACGILFNHESPRRGLGFVTQKVAYAAACAKLGIDTSTHLNEEGEPIVKDRKMALGNLDAERDWGHAADYVEAMWLMLQRDEPDDFVIGTGEVHSIRDLCETAYSYAGADWQDHVVVDQRFVRPTETGPLVANPTKAREILGWEPKITFQELVEAMVDRHVAELSAGD